jgi:hypothetical protein
MEIEDVRKEIAELNQQLAEIDGERQNPQKNIKATMLFWFL